MSNAFDYKVDYKLSVNYLDSVVYASCDSSLRLLNGLQS